MKKLLFGVVVVLAATALASAAVTISAQPATVDPGNDVEISIVSTGDATQVGGMVLSMEVIDMGAGQVAILSGNMKVGIWAVAGCTLVEGADGAAIFNAAVVDAYTVYGGVSVSATSPVTTPPQVPGIGTLCTLVLDTSGLPAHSQVKLGLNAYGVASKLLDPNGGDVLGPGGEGPVATDLVITVTPEPVSALLLGLGGLLLRRRR